MVDGDWLLHSSRILQQPDPHFESTAATAHRVPALADPTSEAVSPQFKSFEALFEIVIVEVFR